MPAFRPKLESSGNPAHYAQERNIQRVLDGIGVRVDEAESSLAAYTPGDATKWASPAPTTIAQALDRLAARLYTVGGSTPIP